MRPFFCLACSRFRSNMARLIIRRIPVKFCRSSNISLALLMLLTLTAAAQDSAPLTRHISANVPVQSFTHTLSADRALVPLAETPLEPPAAHNWQLQATLPGTIIHDMSFASPTTGYAVAEAGQVWKTTNGGKTWTEPLNLVYPYYFYGVTALTTEDVVISGFYD